MPKILKKNRVGVPPETSVPDAEYPRYKKETLRNRMRDGEFKGMTAEEACSIYNIKRKHFYKISGLLKKCGYKDLYKRTHDIEAENIRKAISSGKYKGLTMKEFAKKLGCHYLQVRYAVRTMTAAGMKTGLKRGKCGKPTGSQYVSKNFSKAVNFILGMSESDKETYTQSDIADKFHINSMVVSVILRTLAVLKKKKPSHG